MSDATIVAGAVIMGMNMLTLIAGTVIASQITMKEPELCRLVIG